MTIAPFTTVVGHAVPLMLPNIDTDVIIRIERMASPDLAHWAFESIRWDRDGTSKPGCVLNDPRFAQAPILLAGENFGCGSSREPAVWAVMALGVRCVIAPSFGEIFQGNCLTNGVLPVALDADVVEGLADTAWHFQEITVDLVAQEVGSSVGRWSFKIGAAHKLMLTEGLDEMELCLLNIDKVTTWEANDRVTRPWAWPAISSEREVKS